METKSRSRRVEIRKNRPDALRLNWDALRARGVAITVGHGADNPDLPHATRVVITGAVPADNPELRAAQARKPLFVSPSAATNSRS